jgi:ABC-type uncharacterized transport system substrate-binding protein
VIRRDKGEAQLEIVGKGYKVRQVLIPAEIAVRLFASRGDAPASAPVFQSVRNPGHALTERPVNFIVKAAAKRAGVNPAASVHWLRHRARHSMRSLQRSNCYSAQREDHLILLLSLSCVGGGSETAGARHCSRRYSGRVAARGACAAVGEAADYRILGRRHAFAHGPMDRRFCAAAARTRLDRGSHHRDRSWAEGRSERLAEFAAEFVRLKVDVIVTHSAVPIRAAMQATSVIPIVFGAAADPVGTGLVASLARPGGNVTGLSVQFADLADKRLELLREVTPGLRRLAVMANVGAPGALLEIAEVQVAAKTLGFEVARLEIRQAEDIAPAFEALKGRAEALYICSDPLLATNAIRISTLALAARLPTMHGLREYLEAGGLMSYGANFPDLFRRAAEFVNKILRGSKPADLPVEQPTKYELAMNLKTAKTLGLTIPPTLLARSDEVIE